MDFKEMDEMWHRIREERAKDWEGKTPAEIAASINERAAAIARRLGLKVVSETSPVKRRLGEE